MIALIFLPVLVALGVWLVSWTLNAQEAWDREDWRWDEPPPCDCLICQFERDLAP